ncbi:hypothetical protein [Streptomyces sp. NPDC049906]|uniref:hypothetical protein n=1 Tax=Streptomyces sp. NPDC049906 TaxID=3155656 RepID=UPI003445F38C
MSTRHSRSASVALTALLVAGLTLGCEPSAGESDATPEPQVTGLAEPKLPEDVDEARSTRAAKEFRSWVAAEGTARQQEAAARVDRVLGDWEGESAEAYLSTDLGGGDGSVRDPMGAAKALVAAFDGWKDAPNGMEGTVSVHDVNGTALVVGTF